MIVKNVVLLARVDDPLAGVSFGTYSTIVPVEHHPEASLAEIAEMALELAAPVTDWDKN